MNNAATSIVMLLMWLVLTGLGALTILTTRTVLRRRDMMGRCPDCREAFVGHTPGDIVDQVLTHRCIDEPPC